MFGSCKDGLAGFAHLLIRVGGRDNLTLRPNTVIDDEIPTELIPDDLDPWEKIRLIYKNKIVCIDEDGNVRFTNGSVIDRESLYRKAISFLSKEESPIDLEARPPFPTFKVAKPKS